MAESEWQSIVSTGAIQNSYGSFIKCGRKPTEPLSQYYVEPEDTLAGVSLKCGVTMEDLRRLNKLHYTDTIQSRKYLLIPGQKNLNKNETPVESSVKQPGLVTPPKKVQKDSNNAKLAEKTPETSVQDFLQKLDKQIHSSKQVTSTMLSEKNNYEIPNSASVAPSARFMRRKPSFEETTKMTFSNANQFHNDNDELFQL